MCIYIYIHFYLNIYIYIYIYIYRDMNIFRCVYNVYIYIHCIQVYIYSIYMYICIQHIIEYIHIYTYIYIHILVILWLWTTYQVGCTSKKLDLVIFLLCINYADFTFLAFPRGDPWVCDIPWITVMNPLKQLNGLIFYSLSHVYRFNYNPSIDGSKCHPTIKWYNLNPLEFLGSYHSIKNLWNLWHLYLLHPTSLPNLSIYLSIYLPTYLSIYLSICRSI